MEGTERLLDEKITHVMNTFYYSTAIPIRYIINGVASRSLPKDLLDFPLSKDIEPISAQTVVNPYEFHANDCHLTFILSPIEDEEESYFLAGPVLTEKLTEQAIHEVALTFNANLQEESELFHYYSQLNVCSSTRLEYSATTLFHLSNHNENDRKRVFEFSPRQVDQDKTLWPDVLFRDLLLYRDRRVAKHPYELEKEFINRFKSQDHSVYDLLQEFDEYTGIHLGNGDPIRSFKNRMICSATVMARVVIETGVNPEDALTYSDYVINRVEQLETRNELLQLERDHFIAFHNMMEENRTPGVSPLIQQCIQTIHQSISDRVSLKHISETAGVSQSYLSTLFKKEMGMTMKKYVMQKKIDEARRFLLHTNYSVLDIALYFAFYNQAHFTRVFKEHVGVTPSEYRRQTPTEPPVSTEEPSSS